MENCLLKELVHSEAKGGKLDTKGIIKKVFKTFLLAKERHIDVIYGNSKNRVKQTKEDTSWHYSKLCEKPAFLS